MSAEAAAAIVQAVATVVLVGVTAIYVILTRKTITEMRTAREQSVLPVLTLYVDEEGEVHVRNVGLGPALKVDVTVRLDTDDGSEFWTWCWAEAIIGTGESRSFYTRHDAEELLKSVATVRAVGTYEDSLANSNALDARIDDFRAAVQQERAEAIGWSWPPLNRIATALERMARQ